MTKNALFLPKNLFFASKITFQKNHPVTFVAITLSSLSITDIINSAVTVTLALGTTRKSPESWLTSVAPVSIVGRIAVTLAGCCVAHVASCSHVTTSTWLTKRVVEVSNIARITFFADVALTTRARSSHDVTSVRVFDAVALTLTRLAIREVEKSVGALVA